ncbi:MAG: AAA family ATPase, partial [Saprospiraceae bacterium]|nr:AAA family ATPase [Saprospiraceae bacterium]
MLPVTLSSEFKAVLDQLEYSHDNFFITGRAGTGKSTLLQLFRKTSRKKIAVLAPTGIAALHVRGQTIHSFFGFPPRMLNQKEIEKRKNRRLYTSLEMIV